MPAVGAEIFGFTTAYLRGLGFFSPLDFTIHPSDCCGSTARRPGIRLEHRLSPQLLERFVHLPCGRKVLSASLVLRLYLMDGVFLRGSSRFRRWTVFLGLIQGLPSALFFLVYQREAGFLQAVSLRRCVLPSQEGFNGIASSSRLRSRGRILGRVATKFALPLSRMFLFQGFPHLPFFLVSLAARVDRRWLSRSAREPLGEASSRFRFRILFLPS